jgi:hypothetical protein
MVRIINHRQEPGSAQGFEERKNALIQLFSFSLVKQPLAIQDLLADFGIETSDKPTEKELTEKLLSAVSACDYEFNMELARILLDCTQENEYDHFDFKGLFKKDDSGSEEQNTSGSGGGGIIGGIANAVGGIGNAIGQGIKGKQAKDQATAQTLQGIYNYRAQLAANEKSKGKNKTLIVISILALLLLVIGAMAYMNKNQEKQQPQKV